MKRSEVAPLLKKLADMFNAELKSLPIKPKAREDMLAGFRDGARCAVLQLKADGHLTIEEGV